jgi:hypothetical protein
VLAGPAAPRQLERMVEVARRFLPELQPLPGGGVNEPEHCRVKREPSRVDGVSGRIAVDPVAQHGMAEVGEVHPHLVCAAGSQLRLNQREPPKLLKRPHDRVGRAPARARRQRRPPGTGARAADSARNQGLAGEIAAHKRQIPTLDRVSPELALELLGRGVGQGQHQHARRVAVKTVHDQ